MDVGGGNERKRVRSQFQRRALSDDELAGSKVVAEVALHHRKGHSGGDDYRLGEGLRELLYAGGVVHFHVVDNKVVRLTPSQFLLYVCDPLAAETPVNAVHNSDLVVQYDV